MNRLKHHTKNTTQRLQIRAEPGRLSLPHHPGLPDPVADPGGGRRLSSCLKTWRQGLAKRRPVIALGAPEYCTLADMFAFKRQLYLE